MELQTLQTALQAEGLETFRNGDTVEAFRDWSYKSGADSTTDWYNPADDYVEAYSDTIKITFTGTAFIAVDEFGEEIAREEIIAEFDPQSGITATDIQSAAENIAETIACLLPERDLLEERAEAAADAAWW